MPSFDGVNLFGDAVSMNRVVAPRGVQRNAYPGLSGVEELDQGSRGGSTVAVGRLYGDDAAGLNAMELLFESYIDGLVYELVDNFGNAFGEVKLESFETEGRVQRMAGTGQYHRRYRATFRHLR